MIPLIIMLAITTTGYNKIRNRPDRPPKYWNQNFFLEEDLPDSLKGKPIQYIDSVFKHIDLP